jgi:hypothetical protein
MSDRLKNILERRVGASEANQRQDEFMQLVRQCPPVDPHLIAHLKMVFSNKKDIKPWHPQLGQLLQVQYGIDLLIEYMEARYDKQSLKTRREYEV